MNIQQAIEMKLAAIERREEAARARYAAEQALHEAARHEFATAMRERLELEHGLEFDDDQVATWQVDDTGTNNGTLFSFGMPFNNGDVRTAYDYRLADVTPPGGKLEWRVGAYGGITKFNQDLIGAITYVFTGKI